MSAAVEAWEANRGLMLAHAYRMLGSWQDAEDVVQETWLRFASAPTPRNPAAFLTTVTTRLAIDRLRARLRAREDYVGPWIAEPVATDRLPDDAAIDLDQLSLAAVQLLERLTAPERATYVLRTGFGYSFREIGEVIDRSEASCRQLFRRARARLGQDARFDADRATHRRLLDALVSAARNGSMSQLEEVLATDATLWADGGGQVASALNPIFGPEKIARFLLGISRSGFTARVIELNGLPALLATFGGQPRIIALRAHSGRITEVLLIGNPEKLISAVPATDQPDVATGSPARRAE